MKRATRGLVVSLKFPESIPLRSKRYLMMKYSPFTTAMSLYFVLLFLILFEGCEEPTEPDEPPDTSPPTVTISSPQSGSTVNGIVTITCVSIDNEGVEKVELWVDGFSTGVTDNTVPYTLDWNTTTYEDGSSHIIAVRSYDINGNKADSDTISLYIDQSCSDPNFGDRQDQGLIEYDPINEASGIAVSRQNPNVLWTHNDLGDEARLYAFNLQGRHLGVYHIAGIANRDWEDIAVGRGPVEGKTYIYIGEIGDILAEHDLKFIYRIPEPIVDSNQAPVNTSISGAETITIQYPDGNRDAETLMVDPLTKDIYIISKWESEVGVYRAPYPQSTTQTIILEHVATLNLTQTVGGDISPSGLEILIKTYSTMYYWCRTPEHTLWQPFENEPVTVPYISEPQGEAVGWASDGMGYYTISEELDDDTPAHLYFYPRLTISVDTNE